MDLQMLSWALQHPPTVAMLKGRLGFKAYLNGKVPRDWRDRLVHSEPLGDLRQMLELFHELEVTLKAVTGAVPPRLQQLKVRLQELEGNTVTIRLAGTGLITRLRFLVPRARSGLVGRSAEADALAGQLLAGSAARVLLRGPMGVGKTALGLEICHQVAGSLPGHHCCLLRGTSAASLRED